MTAQQPSGDVDVVRMRELLAQSLDTESVARFQPGPGIEKLSLKFDIAKLREALDICLTRVEFKGDLASGFGAFSLTRRPGVEVETPNDLSGLFFTRVDETYEEVRREEVVDEFKFTEFIPAFKGTYFEHVFEELTKRFDTAVCGFFQRGCTTVIRGIGTLNRVCISR